MPDASPILLPALVAMLLTLAMGLIRALRGPTLQDRMLSVQLLGTGGVALLMMAAPVTTTALLDVALVLALLAAVAAAALTRREIDHD